MATQRKRQGTATVEAVVFLPVLLLLFFGVTFVGKRYDTALQAEETVRLCVTLYAKLGCGGATLPPQCEGVIHRPDEPPPPSEDVAEGDDAIEDARNDERLKRINETLPLLSTILNAIFGAGRAATVTLQSPSSLNVGLRGQPVTARGYALCNTQPVDTDGVADTLFNGLGQDGDE